MAGKEKFKPKYQTERSGPSKKRRDDVEKIANPKSPLDLVLALQHPSSPAYKEMMNQMNARLENIAIIELLVQRHLIDHKLATDKEKNEIFKEQLAQDLMNQQKETIRYHEQVLLAAAERKPIFDEPALKKDIEQQKETINQLKQEVSALNTLMEALVIAGEKIDQDWSDFRIKEKNAFHDLMEKKEISLYTADGTEIKPGTERYRAMLSVKNEPPPAYDNSGPVKTMGIIASSMVLDAAQKHLNANPGEGAPKLDMKEAVAAINTKELVEKVENTKNVNDQLLQMVKLAGPNQPLSEKDEVSPTDILKAIKLNKEANRLKAEHLAEQKAAPSGQQKTEALKQALENQKQRIVARAEIHEKEQQIKQTEAQLAINQKRLDDMQAKKSVENVAPKEDHAPPTKRK